MGSLSDSFSGDLPTAAELLGPQPLPDPPGGGTGPQYTYEAAIPPLPPISEKHSARTVYADSAASARDSARESARADLAALPPAPVTGTLETAAAYTDPFDGLHESSPTKPLPSLGSARRGRMLAGESAAGSGARESSPAAVSLSPPGPGPSRRGDHDEQSGALEGEEAGSDSPGSPPPIKRPPGYYAEIMQRGRAPVRWPPEDTVEVFRADEAELLDGHPQLSADLSGSSDSSGDEGGWLEPQQGGMVGMGDAPLQIWQRHTLEDVPEDSAELGHGASHGATSTAPPSGGDRPVGEAITGAMSYQGPELRLSGVSSRASAHVGLRSVRPTSAAPDPRRRRALRHKSPLRRLTFCLCAPTDSGFEAFSDELPPPAGAPQLGALAPAPRALLAAPEPVMSWAGGRQSLSHAPRAVAVPPLRLLEPRSAVVPLATSQQAHIDVEVALQRVPMRHSVDVAALRRVPSGGRPGSPDTDPFMRTSSSSSGISGSPAGDLFGSPLHAPGVAMEARGRSTAPRATPARPGAVSVPGPIAEATVPAQMHAESASLQSVRIGVVAEAPPRGAALARGRLDFELRRDVLDGKFTRRLRPQVDYWGNKDLALMICRAVLGRDVMDGCEYESAAEVAAGGVMFPDPCA